MRNTIILLGLSFLFVFTSCRKDEDLSKPILGLEGDTWTRGPLDAWLYDNFTKPYNIAVDYRWNGSELGLNNTLVPTKEEQVMPLMNVVKEAWIDVYAEIAGEEFIKKLSPRQYVLVGSPQYNANGTITVGSASAGSKVVIYRTNWFSVEDRAIVKRVLKTIHHEFAHILHQNVMFPAEYELITPADYTSSWNGVADAVANNAGFITPYSMADVNEDFAEMVAVLLTEGAEGYEEILQSITNPDAVVKIRQKEEIVVNYFDQVWGIDLYQVQALTEEAINRISPLPGPDPLHTQIGPDKPYSTLTLSLDEVNAFSPQFNAALAEVNSRMVDWSNRSIDYLSFEFLEPELIRFTMRYFNPSSERYFLAYYDLEVIMNDAGDVSILSWAPNDANSNGQTAQSRISPLLDYLVANNFNFAWYGDPQASTDRYGAFYELNNLSNFFYGILQ